MSKTWHGRVVPTWNYVAMHAESPVEVLDDPARLRDAAARLIPARGGTRRALVRGRRAAGLPRRQLRGIVGIRLRIEPLTGRRKLSQNRLKVDLAGVLADLGGGADSLDRE